MPARLPLAEPILGLPFDVDALTLAMEWRVGMRPMVHRVVVALDHEALPEAMEIYTPWGRDDVHFILWNSLSGDIVVDNLIRWGEVSRRFATVSVALAWIGETLGASVA